MRQRAGRREGQRRLELRATHTHVHTRVFSSAANFVTVALTTMSRNPRSCYAFLEAQGCPHGSDCRFRHDIQKCSCGLVLLSKYFTSHVNGNRHRKLLAEQAASQARPQPHLRHSGYHEVRAFLSLRTSLNEQIPVSGHRGLPPHLPSNASVVQRKSLRNTMTLTCNIIREGSDRLIYGPHWRMLKKINMASRSRAGRAPISASWKRATRRGSLPCSLRRLIPSLVSRSQIFG